MLSELCQEIRNWFDRSQPKLHGAFEISGGTITDVDFLDVIQPNQYFRIMGSVFNDGVHQFNDQLHLTDELFVGTVWLMAIPKEVLDLSKEIDTWVTTYGDKVNSPYSSESFGGYSYTKASGSNTGSGSGNPTWQSTFATRLNKWRKVL